MAIEKNNIEPSLEDQLMETPDPSAVGEEVTIIEEGAETTADEQEPEFNFAENIAERLSENEARRLADDLIAD